jgi:hypothetical protein
MAQFKVGDFVTFGRPNGEQTVGKIVRVNAASLTIEQLEERGSTRIRQAGAKWRVHPSLVRMAGVSTPAPTPAPVKMSEAEIIVRLRKIEFGLEPEVLYCDGERSPSEARRIAARLRSERADLVKLLGREPTSNEIWG